MTVTKDIENKSNNKIYKEGENFYNYDIRKDSKNKLSSSEIQDGIFSILNRNIDEKDKIKRLKEILQEDKKNIKKYLNHIYIVQKTELIYSFFGNPYKKVITNFYTPLIIAIEKNETQLAKFIIDEGGDVNFDLGKDPLLKNNFYHYNNALELAIFKKNSEIANYMLDKKADPNISNYMGVTPLSRAASNKMNDIMKRLIDNGANINQVDHYGLTPVCKAAASNNIEGLKILYDKGVDFNFKRGGKFSLKTYVARLPSTIMANKDKKKLIKILVEEYGVDKGSVWTNFVNDLYLYGILW